MFEPDEESKNYVIDKKEQQKLDDEFTRLVEILGKVTRQVLNPQQGQAEDKDKWELQDAYYTTLYIAGDEFKELPDDDLSMCKAISGFIWGLRSKGYYKVGLMEAPL
jgi:hypothetical protein